MVENIVTHKRDIDLGFNEQSSFFFRKSQFSFFNKFTIKGRLVKLLNQLTVHMLQPPKVKAINNCHLSTILTLRLS